MTEVIKYDLSLPVTVRKYEINVDDFRTFLRDAKKNSGLSNRTISEKVGRPITEVEHWFRTDNCFSIPDKDVWFELKSVLRIDSEEYDASVTEFVEKPGVFEKANRFYDISGIAPTITSASADEKIIIDETLLEGERYLVNNQDDKYIPIPFNYVSLFSGIGGFEQALNKLGGTCVLASEIDKFANQAYEVLYGHSTVGDITKVEAEEVPDHDVLVGGFPCFAAGTLITTRGGVKPIEDVRKGDEVLTHTNTFRPVVVPMVKRKKGIYNVKIQGSPRTQVTEEHPYYAREFLGRKWSNEKGKYEREWSEPKWVNTKDLVPGKHFVGFSENTLSENPHNITEEEAWLIGRYVADGYLRNNKRSGRENQYNNWVVFCIGKDKLNEFKTHISNYYVGYSEERTVYKARIINERFMKLCHEAGRGSENKRVPGYILNLPKHLLEKFLDGYLSGDGSVSEGKYKATSVSKELVYGLGQVVQKLYNVPYSIVFTERPKTTIIEGRTVNQRDTWSIEFRKEARKQNQAVYIDGMLWNPVRSVEYDESFEGNVYNFEVVGDNSYVANNATVHNCQAFSVAGKRGGFEDARGTLFFEMARIAKEKQPKIFLAENVKGLLSHDKGRTMDTIVTTLSDIGYRVDFEVLNSKYFGVPQNRERVFLIGIREDLIENESWEIPKGSTVVPKAKRRLAEYEDLKTFNFEWPAQEEVTTRLRDILESNVDEKYYLDEGKTAKLVAQLEEREEAQVLRPQRTDYGKAIREKIEDDVRAIASKSRKDTDIGITFKDNGDIRPYRTDSRKSGISELQINHEDNPSNTVTSAHAPKTYGHSTRYRIRKLTPRECWRLQNFPDEAFDKVKAAGMSDSQMYKQAGNAVTVSVVEAIGERLLPILRGDSDE